MINIEEIFRVYDIPLKNNIKDLFFIQVEDYFLDGVLEVTSDEYEITFEDKAIVISFYGENATIEVWSYGYGESRGGEGIVYGTDGSESILNT